MERTRREFTITVLKDLIQNCKEEQDLFNRASQKITDPKLIQSLRKYSKNKAECICKLESEIKRLGGEIEKIGNQPNAGEMTKLEIEYDVNKILLECVNKDTMTLNKYSNAIKEEILWEVLPLVAKQYVETQNIHDNLMHSFGDYDQIQMKAV